MSGRAVVAPVPVPTMKPVELLTVTLTVWLTPAATGPKVAAVVVSVKLSVVAVTVRLTVVVTAVLPLVPVTVIACAPEGSAMLGAVVMVRVTGLVSAGTPSSVTLPGLKLQSAPAGRFAVQLPGLEAVEFVKVTEPVKPLVGLMFMV